MAIVNHTHKRIGTSGCYRTLWEGLTIANPDGQMVSSGQLSDRSIHILGTLSGATLTLQGSNQEVPTGAGWETLHDAAGNEIAVTSTGIYLVAENVVYIRPLISGGDGSTDVDAILVSKAT